jgi:hypothetical protein
MKGEINAGFIEASQPFYFLPVILKKVSMQEDSSEKGFKTWIKRIGIAGFLFFFIKGLVWIAIFVGVGKCATG